MKTIQREKEDKEKNSQIPKELNTIRGKAKRVGAREWELEWKGLNKRV